eukprot:TRINITY_DN1474_c0_g4_i1.p1 TRINITY_DN1474_c0_g4~~TRINITY_DN1474_c0_g4_i1.p1  ORF type:complete len:794 (+),score=265.37 TRINITY_DN1474_c0_g4_i1:54-2435(+)
MAEARMAATPMPAVTLDVGVDPAKQVLQAATSEQGLTVFIPAPRFLLRGMVRAVLRGYNNVVQAFMPVPLPCVTTVIAGAIAVVLRADSTSWWRNSRFANVLWDIDTLSPLSRRMPVSVRVGYLTFETSLAVMLMFTFCHRMLLKALLSYMGWMDEARGEKSWKTTVWGAFLKFIYIRSSGTKTLQFQTSMPCLPVPALRDTIDRYLLSMEPILNEPEMAALRTEAAQFLAGEGPKLNRYLVLKSWKANNYVSDWWLDIVYLRGRDSIMINSNYYGLGIYEEPPTHRQASRAAFIISSLLGVKRLLEQQKLAPQMIQGMVPLCMAQYGKTYGTTREPHAEQDRLRTYDESRHIVVMHKGRYYKLMVYSPETGRPVSWNSLERALEGILADASQPSPTEQHLAALTGITRPKWAAAREEHFLRDRVNRAALHAIESAIVVLALDDTAPGPLDLTAMGRNFLHGTGASRWFDKSFQACVCRNAVAAINGEHSWGDAPTLSHSWEHFMAAEAKLQPYNATGRLTADPNEPALVDLPCERLVFNTTAPLQAAVAHAVEEVGEAIDALDLQVYRFGAFGKGAITKVLKCSPDGFIQAALQLAYYRDQGEFVQTYESATQRLYREGRTETIRSCSNHTKALVEAVEGGAPKAECLQLLRAATANHQRLTQLAMTGRGVDRHLFGLYVVAVGTSTDSAFLKSAMGRGWKLSTSQVPEKQCTKEWADPTPEGVATGDAYQRVSGGFGPVADDGYGVSYVVSGTKQLFFHVSSKRTCGSTDSARMYKHIQAALADLRALGDE